MEKQLLLQTKHSIRVSQFLRGSFYKGVDRVEIKQFDASIPDAIFAGVQAVHTAVFDGAQLEKGKLVRKNLIALVAIEEDDVVGFKFGYEHEDGAFYSWLGGVHPAFQRRGIAKSLMEYQHTLVKDLGYQLIRTYSRNEEIAMLLLNLQSGYHVISTFVDDKGWHKIVLEKKL